MKNFPAFPVSPELQIPNENDSKWTGLTKRELFTMAAMQGLLAHPDMQEGLLDLSEKRKMPPNEILANMCIELADSFLSALEKSRQ